MSSDTVIVGAGVGGLSCARSLADAGVAVQVLEKSRGLGGRCATRRIDLQPVDHGLAFLHGDDGDFIRTIVERTPDLVEDWPRRIAGDGVPCQRRAFRPGERRFAPIAGVSSFAKGLASDLEVALTSRVMSLRVADDRIRLAVENSRDLVAGSVVLALPAAQSLELLRTLSKDARREFEAVEYILGSISSARCLTVIAVYPDRVTAPDWEMAYPENSTVLQLVSHDSGKRREPAHLILVLQALPAWSLRHWGSETGQWRDAILAEAGRLFGEWTRHPSEAQTHRWRFARLTGGGEMTAPPLVTLRGGAKIGFLGEAFAPGGGVQAAWRSGTELARRLIGDQKS